MSKFFVKGYVTGAATADAAIVLTIPKNGRLIAIQACIRSVVAAAVTEHVQFEVSQQSTQQAAVNDATGVIATIANCAPSATANLQTVTNIVLGGFAVEFVAGQKLYVHRTSGSNFSAVVFNAIFFFA